MNEISTLTIMRPIQLTREEPLLFWLSFAHTHYSLDYQLFELSPFALRAENKEKVMITFPPPPLPPASLTHFYFPSSSPPYLFSHQFILKKSESASEIEGIHMHEKQRESKGERERGRKED
jgi:hypothetical protein